jgi:ketosteroid isomerase-like protein
MLTWRSEQFGEHDLDAVRDRFDELCAEQFDGVTLSRSATAAIPSEVVKLRRDWGRRFDAQDWSGLEALYAPGAVQRDRRSLGTERLAGPAAIVGGLRRGAELGTSITVRQELLEAVEVGDALVCGLICRFAGAAPEGGGTFESSFGALSVVRDGRIIDSEVCEPDPAIILEHLGELRPQPRSEISDAIAAGWERFAAGFTNRDWDAVRAQYADDVVHVDRRLVGWDRVDGVEGDIAQLQSMLSVIPNAVLETELLAGDGDGTTNVSAGVFAWRGEHEGGAPAELAMGMVVVSSSDGKVRLIENLDADDRAGMLTRYDELCAQHLVRGGPTPIERVCGALVDALNKRDWDAVRGMLSADATMTDRRGIAQDIAAGADAIAAIYRSIVDVVPDARWGEQVIAANGALASLAETTVSGSVPDGGGRADVAVLTVRATTPEGRLRIVELFDPGDGEAARVRLDELAAALVTG